MILISPKITNLGYSNLWTDMSTILGYASNFDQQIQKLFVNGEQGFFYDPNDLSTMFQDSTGTVPITAAGQPVGLIRDKSGRNNHAYQTNSSSRPILRKNAVTGAYYLEFDGADDFLVTNSIDFTVTDKISLFVGVRKLSDATQIIVELSYNANLQSGSFYLTAGYNDGENGYSATSRGSAISQLNQLAKAFPYPVQDTSVLSIKHDISGDLTTIQRNRVAGLDATGDKGTGNFGNYPLYIGKRGDDILELNGHIYGLIGVGKLVSDDETAAIEKELAKRVGVTLNV